MSQATSTGSTVQHARRTAARWIHVCNGLVPRRDGGMVPSILGFTGALARRECDLTIVTPTPSDHEALRIPPRVELVGPVDDVSEWVAESDVVHFHGLWQRHTRQGTKAARRYRVPHLIAAHGMAEPWALRHKAWKKKLYTWLVEGKNLKGADCLHALTRPEVSHLRALAPRTPVCLVPNGVDLAPFDQMPGRAELEAEHPELAGKFVVLFLGRLHAKKGLDLLARAMGTLAADHPELHILLAGNDDGALGPFQSLVAEVGCSDRVTTLGHVAGEQARKAWAAADAFALPSYSEGFSMAVLEALAARLPSLITTACHFPELGAVRGGVVVEPNAEDVTRGLRQILEMDQAERADMAARGRLLVEQQYTWDRQADRLDAVYRWMMGGGPAPECVNFAGGER